MKELSVEEKAKAYDEAIKRAKSAIKECGNNQGRIAMIESIFPELKESEDEKMMHQLYSWMKEFGGAEEYTEKVYTWLKSLIEKQGTSYTKRDVDDAYVEGMAFAKNELEKQGEQKPILNVPPREVILSIWDLGNEWKELTNGCISTEYGTQLDYIQKHWHESEYYLREKQGEQKLPIEKLPEEMKTIGESLGFTTQEECDEYNQMVSDLIMSDNKVKPKFHEGEWVVFNDKHESVYQIEKIENFQYTLRHILGGSMPLSFSGEDMIRPWAIQDAKDSDVLACNEEILLFKSYSVQGRISLYCWYNGQTNNFHSKEVVDTLMTTRNKIYPATKEQRDILFSKMKEAGYTFDFEKKELKKMQKEWSEEDEEMFEYTISLLNYNLGCRKWLKSLKERYTWKPSDKQMHAFEQVYDWYNNNFAPSETLTSLYKDLEKLKGE